MAKAAQLAVVLSEQANKKQKTALKAVLASLLTDIGKRLVENFGSPQGSDMNLMFLIA